MAWDKLKTLFSPKVPIYAHFDDPFILIDKSQTSEKFSLSKRGKENGEINHPDEDALVLDEVESELIAHIEEHYSRSQKDAANNIRTYDHRLADLSLLTSISSIKTESIRAVGDFKLRISNALNRLSNSKDAIVSSYEELRDFRNENNIKRPAHPAAPAIATYGGIGIAWVSETFINMFLLKQNDAMGYLGGVIAAATVGIINVLVCAFVGRMIWPRTHLNNSIQRALAWLGVCVWLVAFLTWNLLAAYFRDAKSLGLDTPERAALEMFGQGLDSIYSWGLLAAGLIFGMGAAIAAYRMDDPYPGYGPVYRRHTQRCEDYAAEVEEVTDALQEIRDEAINEATEIRRELESQLGERTQIDSARSTYIKRLTEHKSHLETITNALLQEYRTSNKKSRSTPAPKYFNEKWGLTENSFNPPPAINITEGDIRSAETALDTAITEIAAEFDVAVSNLEPLDELKRRIAQ